MATLPHGQRMLADLRSRTVCRTCDSRATEDRHKADPVLVCPDCGEILVRL